MATPNAMGTMLNATSKEGIIIANGFQKDLAILKQGRIRVHRP